MRSYEFTIVLAGRATAAKKKDVVSRIEKMVKALGGKIEASEDWGVKDLAYKIRKNETGIYLFFELSLPPSIVASVNEKVKMEDDIIRHLLVLKEK